MIRSRAAIAGLALILAGCGMGERRDAAKDVAAFLEAARTGDRAAFEARIDREAVRADVKAQLLENPQVKALQSQLGDAVGEKAVNRMISPEAFQAVRASPALALPQTPQVKDIEARLKSAGKGRVCFKDREVAERCLMTFERVGKAWKLVGLYAGGFEQIAPAES